MESLNLLTLSALCLIGTTFIYRYKAIRNKYITAVIFILTICAVVMNGFWLVCHHFTGDGVSQAVLYTLTDSLEGAEISDYILPSLFAIIACVVLTAAIYLFLCKALPGGRRNKLFTVLACITGSMAVVLSPTLYQVSGSTLLNKKVDGSDFSQYYVNKIKNVEKPQYNLVYIYGESLERTYFDEKVFPDLLPDLNKQRAASLDFSNTEQMPATDFTIAGLVASQCGLPLFKPTAFSGENAGNTFYPDSVCLGDILTKSGYETWFFQGANTHFADKDAFFRVHGIKHVWGLNESGMKDNFDVQNNWGLYDNVVLDNAWQKFSELSAAGQRFALFTLTVDTHPPKGFISPGCKKNSYQIDGQKADALSAVLCSQEDIARFVQKIQASPWAKNTIIVLSSDHLAMASTAVSIDYLNKMERRNLFFILGDTIKPAIQTQPRTTLDNGATVLELLGGEKAIGLGRSSLSEKSLSESVPDFRNKLYAWGDSIRNLWGVPDHIDRFVINAEKNTFTFDDHSYGLPLLINIKPHQVLPMTDDGSKVMSLRQSLSTLTEGEQFIWVDKCFRPGNIWRNEFALSQDWCLTQGKMGGKVTVEKVSGNHYEGNVLNDNTATDTARYRWEQSQLKIHPTNIRYASDSFKFGLEGTPTFIENMMGLSRLESWGRWSDALMAPSVLLLYNAPFPREFNLEIEAKAFGKNINAPVAVKIGDQTQYARFGKDPTKVTLRFTGDMYTRLLNIVPPTPELTREGSVLGSYLISPVRRLGVGLIEVKIVPIVNKTAAK